MDCLKDVGIDVDEMLFTRLQQAERECTTCRSYKKQKLRPVVHFALAKEFNKVVSLNLVQLNKGANVLHMEDQATGESTGKKEVGRK